MAHTNPAAFDDRAIHVRAMAMVQDVCDSIPDRLTLLHAAALLHASLAHGQPNPTAALEEMLDEQASSTRDILRTALAMTENTPIPERKS